MASPPAHRPVPGSPAAPTASAASSALAPTTGERGGTAVQFWLMKSEPDEVSIDDLAAAPGQTLPWTGVRNYQARNFMRDRMQVGDGVLFYHSSCAEPGIAGVARIAGGLAADTTQWDPASPYFDPRSPRDAPRWLQIDVSFVRKTPLLPLKALRSVPALQDMLMLRPGNRLSITPVSQAHWDCIHRLWLRPA